MSETRLNRRTLELLAEHQVLAWRNNTGAGWFIPHKPGMKRPPGARWIEFGKPGSGDIIGVAWSGRHFEIEDKSEGGRQGADQRLHQRIVEKRGGLYFVNRTLDDARSRLPLLVARP